MRHLFGDLENKILLAKDVKNAYAELILCFSFFDLNELPSIGQIKDSLYVFSSSEPYDEEQEIDFRRLHNWLKHFNIIGFGLPIEKNGGWEIPENEKGLHASGHACGNDLLGIVREIKPEYLIPIHSQCPEFYLERLSGEKVVVNIPAVGNPISVL